jgi:predicted HTH domain antitoxin
MQTFGTTTFQHIIASTDPINAFKNGKLSLSQLSKSLNQNIETTLQILGDLKIPIADYSIEEEIETLDRLGL